MKIEELNEAVSKETKIITRLIRGLKLEYTNFKSKVQGAHHCFIKKDSKIMKLFLGNSKSDKKHPMEEVIKLNLTTGIVTITIPKSANKQLIEFVDALVSKLINDYEKYKHRYVSDKSISITHTATSLRIGRGEGEDGANKLVKPGESAEIPTKSKKLPTVLD